MSSLPHQRAARVFMAALLLSAGSAWAQPPSPLPGDGQSCATGSDTDHRLETLHEWVNARDQRLEKSGTAVVRHADSRIESDIVLLEATPSILPFHHPFDLAQRSITYTPGEEGAFDVETSSLRYDVNVGDLFHEFEYSNRSDWFYRIYNLGFEFPLGNRTYRRLYITAQNAIYFSPPTLLTTEQIDRCEALSLDGPLIAPLLHTDQGTTFPLPTVFAMETPDALTVTWRSGPSESGFRLDIQARIESTGRIRFSYRIVNEFAWGTVLVTTGDEPWRQDRTRLYSQGTPARDVIGTVAQMRDLQSVTIDRIGDSNVLELTLTVAARISQSSLDSDDLLGYQVDLRDSSGTGDWVYLWVMRDEIYYRAPGWDWIENSPAGTWTGSTIVLRVLEDSLNLTSDTVTATIRSFDSYQADPVDEISGTFSLGSWSTAVGTDLSAVTAGDTLPGPIVESFTLGLLDLYAVWSDMKSSYWFNDNQVDGVAIFQDFYTDLILWAGAYSTVGNPSVDGISTRAGYGTEFPRRASLLHMNKLGYGRNVDLRGTYKWLSHEFGHRWLYFIDIDQGSGSSNVLQPLGGHPAQYVHTPAAFNVYTGSDSSTMGGARFTDRGNGTFSTPPERGFYGYSWHDLYLMGLAAPEEVEPWYYIEGSNPPLGGAYYPPAGITVTGRRRNVTIGDVIRAMGPRWPRAAESQKHFKMIFVLLSAPGTEPTPASIEGLNDRRLVFQTKFSAATGYRATVDTTVEQHVRRRGARR